MMMQSLHPHTKAGQMAIYKYTLHHSANMVQMWFLEILFVWVSILNRCTNRVDHHFEDRQWAQGNSDNPDDWTHHQAIAQACLTSAVLCLATCSTASAF